eukprot:3932568-Rhodomonas_salina.1
MGVGTSASTPHVDGLVAAYARSVPDNRSSLTGRSYIPDVRTCIVYQHATPQYHTDVSAYSTSVLHSFTKVHRGQYQEAIVLRGQRYLGAAYQYRRSRDSISRSVPEVWYHARRQLVPG